MVDINKLSSKIIGAAIEVHKILGPGVPDGIVRIVNELDE